MPTLAAGLGSQYVFRNWLAEASWEHGVSWLGHQAAYSSSWVVYTSPPQQV